MKIRDILELTQTEQLAQIARNHVGVSKERLRIGMKKAGCYSKNGVKGWFFDGDASVLEQSIHDFVEPSKINRKPSPNVSTNELSSVGTKDDDNLGSNDEKNVVTNESNEPTFKPSKESTNEHTNVPTISDTKNNDKEVQSMGTKEGNNVTSNKGKNQGSNERNNAGTNEVTNVTRKRSSFDLDVELMKSLKIQAVIHDRNVYEIVETAIRQYLNGMEK